MNNRNKELAKIHIGAKAVGMDTSDKSDESDYRRMLWTVARVRSSADLDEAGRHSVLAHLRSCGAKFQKRNRPTPANDKAAMVGKIKAMLISAKPSRPDSYCDAMAKKMFHVERYEWCTPEQLHKIIAALVYDQNRKAQQS